MQVVGPWGGDWRTLRLAAHIAQLTGGYVPPSLTGGQAPQSNA
jgi:hypothetical protein